MLRILCTLFAVSLAYKPIQAEALRGQSSGQPLTCRITLLHTLEQRHDGSIASKHETTCIHVIDGIESSMFYSIALPDEIHASYEAEMETGVLLLHIESGLIQDERVQILGDWSVVGLSGNQITRRKLRENQSHSVAVVRVSMAGSQVVYSASEIVEHFFEKQNSMSRQFFNCLNGQLILESAGLFEITVPGKTTDYASPSAIRNKALEIVSQQANVVSAGDLADHVMVILPENDFSFVANAGVNNWLSTYNNRWALDMIVYMHEIGHNLGLGHAVLGNGAPDYSSYMSPTNAAPNLSGPLKCFNAADNRKLGFFDGRSRVVSLDEDPIQFIPVAAFSEWAKQSKGDPVLVFVGKYTLQYNLASQHNSGTEILRNMLTIAYDEPANLKSVVYSKGLEPNGGTFVAESFASSGQRLQVQACQKFNGDANIPSKIIVLPCEQLHTISEPTGPTAQAPVTLPRGPATPTACGVNFGIEIDYDSAPQEVSYTLRIYGGAVIDHNTMPLMPAGTRMTYNIPCGKKYYFILLDSAKNGFQGVYRLYVNNRLFQSATGNFASYKIDAFVVANDGTVS